MDFHHPNYTGSGSIKYSTNDIDITVQNTKPTPVEICVLVKILLILEYSLSIIISGIKCDDDSFSGEYVQYGIGLEFQFFVEVINFRTLNINFNLIKNNEVIYSPDVNIQNGSKKWISKM